MAYLQYCVHHAAQPALFLIKNELVLQRGELDMPKTLYVYNFRHVIERGVSGALGGQSGGHLGPQGRKIEKRVVRGTPLASPFGPKTIKNPSDFIVFWKGQ